MHADQQDVLGRGRDAGEIDAVRGAPDPVGLLAALPDPVVVIDASARVVWANRAAEDWAGWRLEEWRGRAAVALVHPDDVATAVTSLRTVQDKVVGSPIEMRLADRWGTYHRFEVRGRSAVDTPGVRGIVLALRDVTERKRWELAAGAAPALQAILDHAPAITMIIDADGTLRSASRGLTNIVGHDLESAIGRPLADLADPAHAALVRAELGAAAAEPGARTFEAAFTSAFDGAPVPLNVTVVNLLDDLAVEGLVATAVDITSLTETRARLHHLATHDVLTGLPNRALFLDRLEQCLARLRRSGGTLGLIYCDVDDFKAVNDAHGHAAGDAALMEIGRRLGAVIRATDTVARIGGDEFVVIIDDDDPAVTDAAISRLTCALHEPIGLSDGAAVAVSLSCGAIRARGDDEPGSLLSSADAAMYVAKRAGARS
jgi:diguanylate cyclase (GGDEF)-like protein/PAS domain S-box-containing protein